MSGQARSFDVAREYKKLFELGDRFRRDLRQGVSAKIESYLNQISTELRAPLLRNLLEAEILYRRNQGEEPQLSEYQRRFPNDEVTIREVLSTPSELKERVQETSVTTVVPDKPIIPVQGPHWLPQEQLQNRLGDYELSRVIGEGAQGFVYEAFHRQTGNRVALKTLRIRGDGLTTDYDQLHRFRREFRSLSEVNHPNLIGMQSLEVDGGCWFLTMDMVDGIDFLSYVRPDSRLDEQRLRSCLRQLASGLLDLHRRKKLHRDLKPSNVLVSDNGHLVILDFGLVADVQSHSDATHSKSALFAGTPPYAAPEQLGNQKTEANDWYGLGSMLYEALAGEVPFPDKGQDAYRWMMRKQTEDPPQLAGRLAVPRDLAELADGLIKRNASERWGAQEVIRVLRLSEGTNHEWLGTVADDSSIPLPVWDIEDPSESDTLGEFAVVGREDQLEELMRSWDEFASSQASAVIWVNGLSGEGKSTLVRKFLEPIRNNSAAVVLSGRCYDRESVPFNVIDNLMESLAGFLRQRPKNDLDAWLPRGTDTLANLFPILRKVPAVNKLVPTNLTGLDDRQVSNIAFEALRELFCRIGQLTPIVLFVDDLQWGDADSARVILKMLLGPHSAKVCFIGSYRTDEKDRSPFLREWSAQPISDAAELTQRTVQLTPLSADQCLKMLSQRLGKEVEELTQNDGYADLVRVSQGNPYFLEQLLEGHDAATGRFDQISLEEVIKRRLARCPMECRDMLEALAVAGKEVPLSELSLQSDRLSDRHAIRLRNEKLLRFAGKGGVVDTYHDKIRETVYASMPTGKRGELHYQFAQQIAERCNVSDLQKLLGHIQIAISDLVDLAYHTLAANSPGTFYVQLRAGEESLKAFAVDAALEHLRNAERFTPETCEQDTKFRLNFAMAEALVGTKNVGGAGEYYQRAIRYTDDQSRLARCYVGLGISSMRLGELQTAKEYFEESLASLGEKIPKHTVAKVYSVSANLLSLMIRPFDSRNKESSSDQDELFLSKIYSLYRHVCITDLLGFAYSGIRVVVLSRKWNSVNAKAAAVSNLALQMSLSGGGWIANRYAQKAEELIEVSDSDYAIALTKMHLSAHYFVQAKLEIAEKLALESLETLRKERDYAYYMALHWLRHIASSQGNAAKIRFWGEQEFELGSRTNDKVVIAYACYGIADAAARCGELEQSVAASQRSIDILSAFGSFFRSISYQEAARVQLQASNYRDAEKQASESIRVAWREYAIVELNMGSYGILTEAIGGPRWNEGRKTLNWSKRRRLASMARRARWVGLFFPSLKAHSLRVSGRAAAALGRTRRALKYFDLAIEFASGVGAQYEQARALIDRSQLGYSGAAADLTRGLEILETLGCVLPDDEIELLGLDHEEHYVRAEAARESERQRLEKAYL